MRNRAELVRNVIAVRLFEFVVSEAVSCRDVLYYTRTFTVDQ